MDDIAITKAPSREAAAAAPPPLPPAPPPLWLGMAGSSVGVGVGVARELLATANVAAEVGATNLKGAAKTPLPMHGLPFATPRRVPLATSRANLVKCPVVQWLVIQDRM